MKKLCAQLGRTPCCNFCDNDAAFDAATLNGSWAYVCLDHFVQQGCKLGEGRGQAIVVPFAGLSADVKERVLTKDKEDKLFFTDGEVFE